MKRSKNKLPITKKKVAVDRNTNRANGNVGIKK